MTTEDGVVCNKKSAATTNEAGPYFLREIYPTKAAQDAHGQDSEALAAFRAIKSTLTDFKDPDRVVDQYSTRTSDRGQGGERRGVPHD